MKLAAQTVRRIVWIALFLASVSFGFHGADPVDDFSFSLHASVPHGIRLNLMSEERVASVFRDRLDLFPKSQVPRLTRHFLNLCKAHDFDPAFVLSLIEVESRFRIKAVSPAGAVGLMQLMPATAALVLNESWQVGQLQGVFSHAGLDATQLKNVKYVEKALKDPFLNLTAGIIYLSWLRDRYRDFSPYFLVAAYNVGPARMDGLLSRGQFKPVNTKRYFDAIRRGMPSLRFYRRPASSPSAI